LPNRVVSATTITAFKLKQD